LHCPNGKLNRNLRTVCRFGVSLGSALKMKPNWIILPIIIVGVAIGTLIALYVAEVIAQQKLQDSGASSSFLGKLIGL
jgi:hypothetical protein